MMVRTIRIILKMVMKIRTRLTMTKLDDEISGVMKSLKNWRTLVSDAFADNPPPAFIMLTIDKLVNSGGLTWFLAGMSIEALGLAVQVFLRVDTYPILDGIVAGVLALGLYAYQGRLVQREKRQSEKRTGKK